MSRFENLEFGEAKPGPLRTGGAEGTPVRSAGFFLEQADKQYLAGDFELALRNYSRALEQNAAEYEGWSGQVRMLIELGEYEEALMWSDKALELYPEHPDLLAAKAVAACRTGDLEKALAYTDQALTQKGATPAVWLARAEVLLERGSATAKHCVSNAVANAGNAAPAVELAAGRTLLRAGHCGLALGHLSKAVGFTPGAALAWLELGRCQAALGLPEAAMTLAQCLTLRPGWSPARDALDRFQRRGLLARVRSFLRRKPKR
jgi:tetratricopeptide (TPR) repeat protein